MQPFAKVLAAHNSGGNMFGKTSSIGGKKRFGLAGGAAAAALLATVIISPPAKADIAQCPSNRACAWNDEVYQGPFGSWSSSARYVGGGFNDQISSVRNSRTAYINWYTDADYSGWYWSQAPNTAGYFSFGDWRNDSFSAVWLY